MERRNLNVSGLQIAECSRADSADAGQEAIGFTETKQDAVWCGGLWCLGSLASLISKAVSGRAHIASGVFRFVN